MIVKAARFSMLAIGLLVTASQPCLRAQGKTTDTPETVLATFRVKADQLDAFLRLMPKYRATLREKNLVTAGPYLLLKGEEDGKPLVILRGGSPSPRGAKYQRRMDGLIVRVVGPRNLRTSKLRGNGSGARRGALSP